MVLKPCPRPPKQPMVQEGLPNGFKTMCKANFFSLWIIQFFIFYYFDRQEHYNISLILCFVYPHFIFADNSIFTFYCFVRQEHYNISLILGCFSGRHLFWQIIKTFIFYYFVSNKRYKIDKRYKISLILGCRAPLGAMSQHDDFM